MIIEDNSYDVDNVDLEEEMLIKDLEEEAQEEQDLQDLEKEQEEIKIQEEAEKTYFQSRRNLTAKNLNLDLGIEVEDLRPIYAWESFKDGLTYEGCVVHKIDNNTFIFNASILGKNEFKLKKIDLTTVKQIKK